MKRPIVTRGLIVFVPAKQFHPSSMPLAIGETVGFRFPMIYDPMAFVADLGRVATAVVQSIDAGVVQLRVLLKPEAGA